RRSRSAGAAASRAAAAVAAARDRAAAARSRRTAPAAARARDAHRRDDDGRGAALPQLPPAPVPRHGAGAGVAAPDGGHALRGAGDRRPGRARHVSQLRAIRIERPRLQGAAAPVPEAERAEMAVASYCHPNPAIRWLFWRRLDTALALARVGAGERVLDFGTGTGVLLPTLVAAGARVAATDVELRPA